MLIVGRKFGRKFKCKAVRTDDRSRSKAIKWSLKEELQKLHSSCQLCSFQSCLA